MNIPGENCDGVFCVSGLDCAVTPAQIIWQVEGGNSQADINPAIMAANGACVPILIACSTAKLEIRAGRDIQYVR